MFQFIGYDFLSGFNALNFAPNEVEDITTAKLSNAVFDNFNVTHDNSLFENTTIPPDWAYETILNADFNGTTEAGNLEYMVGQISGIKIKRRIKGDFDWITLKYIPVTDVDSLVFTFNDFLNGYNVIYEYALVPIINGVEGEYIINEILSKFDGVFIGNAEEAFRMLYEVSYGTSNQIQNIGSFMPLGKKYPIIVANGALNYQTGSVSSTLLNDSFDNTGKIDKNAIVAKKEKFIKFLSDKKPKILKDWNGNVKLVIVVDNIQIDYKQSSGMSIPEITFNWAEVGDANSQRDLYDAGLTKEPN